MLLKSAFHSEALTLYVVRNSWIHSFKGKPVPAIIGDCMRVIELTVIDRWKEGRLDDAKEALRRVRSDIIRGQWRKTTHMYSHQESDLLIDNLLKIVDQSAKDALPKMPTQSCGFYRELSPPSIMFLKKIQIESEDGTICDAQRQVFDHKQMIQGGKFGTDGKFQTWYWEQYSLFASDIDILFHKHAKLVAVRQGMDRLLFRPFDVVCQGCGEEFQYRHPTNECWGFAVSVMAEINMWANNSQLQLDGPFVSDGGVPLLMVVHDGFTPVSAASEQFTVISYSGGTSKEEIEGIGLLYRSLMNITFACVLARGGLTSTPMVGGDYVTSVAYILAAVFDVCDYMVVGFEAWFSSLYMIFPRSSLAVFPLNIVGPTLIWVDSVVVDPRFIVICMSNLVQEYYEDSAQLLVSCVMGDLYVSVTAPISQRKQGLQICKMIEALATRYSLFSVAFQIPVAWSLST